MAASSALERAQAFQHALARGVADDVRELPFGFALSTPSLPAAFAVNGLWVVGLHPGLTVTDLLARADAHAGEQAHRHVEVRDETTGRRLEPAFRADGFRAQRELIMLLEGEPDRAADTGRVREVPLDAIEEVELAVWRDDASWGPTEAEMRDLIQRDRRLGGVVRERCFAVLGDDDAPVAFAKLLSDGTVAQVEDVGTAPAARRQGHARALVTHAVALARAEEHEVVFIVAEDDGRPPGGLAEDEASASRVAVDLYVRLGFAPAARTFSFTRR